MIVRLKHLFGRCMPLLLLILTGLNAKSSEAPWSHWEAYSQRFIDPQGRVIDPLGNNRTTSEGQSYALFFALVNNDRARFDQLLMWTTNNLAGGDMRTHLPGWLWGKSKEGDWKLLDKNPAADSDCWIAYDLLEAGKAWKDPAYTAIARKMLAMIAAKETADVPGFGLMVMPGLTSLFVHNQVYTLNLSYVPVFLFERFAQVDPAGPWGAIAINIPRLARQSSPRGFAMDWVNYTAHDGVRPAPNPGLVQPGKKLPPALGSYDAIRVYLWAGMLDPTDRARMLMLTAVSGMGVYLANHGAPPEKVSDQGLPMEQDGPVGFSAAVLPYLRAIPGSEQAAAQQAARVEGQLDKPSGLYGKDPAYYDQNLVLFANGFLEGRFRFGPHGELKLEWEHS